MILHRHKIEGHCLVEIEHSPASLHVHAVPIDVAIAPGDRVIVHEVRAPVPGDLSRRECRITVERAGPLLRAWTRLTSIFAITELYEVGFEAEATP